MNVKELNEKMNQALGWELRAITMYSHYSAYIRGIHRLQLADHFKSEAAESLMHAETIRAALVKMSGIATTDRDPTPIIHTTSYEVMLEQALQTEIGAAAIYGEILEMIGDNDKELYDSVEAIYFAEERSVEEMRMLME